MKTISRPPAQPHASPDHPEYHDEILHYNARQLPDILHYGGQGNCKQVLQYYGCLAWTLNHTIPLFYLDMGGCMSFLKAIQGTFIVNWGLVVELVSVLCSFSFGSSRYVDIEEQLAIFLYMSVTGLTILHTGEQFQ